MYCTSCTVGIQTSKKCSVCAVCITSIRWGKMINDLIMGLVAFVNGQCKTEGLLVCINHMVKRIVIIIIV